MLNISLRGNLFITMNICWVTLDVLSEIRNPTWKNITSFQTFRMYLLFLNSSKVCFGGVFKLKLFNKFLQKNFFLRMWYFENLIWIRFSYGVICRVIFKEIHTKILRNSFELNWYWISKHYLWKTPRINFNGFISRT